MQQSLPLHDLVSVDELIGRLDSEGWLLGTREVCPAPVHRIREAWEAFAEPSATTELPASAIETADRARDIVVGLWAILGATRAVIEDARADHVANWSPIGEIDPEWPEVLVLLRNNGPGALVRHPWVTGWPSNGPTETRALFWVTGSPGRVK